VGTVWVWRVTLGVGVLCLCAVCLMRETCSMLLAPLAALSGIWYWVLLADASASAS